MTPALGGPALARAVRSAGIDVEPVWRDVVGSTNTEAMRMAAAGAPSWTVVAAGHQSEGRGRLGRTWVDVPGDSLLVSIVLPTLAVQEAPLVSLLAAAVMVEAAGAAVLRSKWPNDLMAGDRKVGGILVEARVGTPGIEHLVLGMGVNLSASEEALPEGATTLTAAGADADPERVLTGFLSRLRSGLQDPRFPGSVPERYAAVCSTIGRSVRAVTTGGAAVEGTAVAIDARGGLVVESDGSRSIVAFGEVGHLR